MRKNEIFVDVKCIKGIDFFEKKYYNVLMFVEAYAEFKMAASLARIESWIFWTLLIIVAIALLFSLIFVFYKNLRRGKARKPLLAVCFLFLIVVFAVGACVPAGVFQKSGIGFLEKFEKAYESRWIKTIHIAAAAALCICCSVLVFARGEKTSKNSGAAGDSKKNIDMQVNTNRYDAFFSQFDSTTDDDSDSEIFAVGDVFCDLGNSESDVQNSIERMAKKLRNPSSNPKYKATVKEISSALGETPKPNHK